MRRLSDITIQVDDRFGSPAPRHGAARPRPLPPRGQAQQIRRRISPFWLKRVRRIAAGSTLALLLAATPLWLLDSAAGQALTERAHAQIVAWSGRAGFRVQQIYVEGRHRTPTDELVAALNVKRGDPIFGIDLAAARQRLEEISWVKTATLERRLPGEVHILLTERDPVAIWQNEGHYYLVDQQGLVVSDDVRDFSALPLIVGEGAPDHAAALLAMLATEPALAKRVKAAQWVSGRRWNVTFDSTDNGIDVRLPEDDPAAAWHDLDRYEKNQQILERKIALIDMRIPDRLVLRAVGGAEENARAAMEARHKSHPGKDA
ncbi:cell division protein FtsQ [mine drainage metagenome]|uniref:Cell division protein FtsQ n=1 Tax=mine drainage metagenome TaxID=410659 RepID=A0A1J5SNC6_9ZZZZ